MTTLDKTLDDTQGESGLGEGTDYESVFLDQLSYIEHVIGFIARRHALNYADAEDFEGWVKLRLLQDDYAVLRKFRGKSKLSTFLTTVIHNLYRDFRIHRWGKWRASAAAKRMGEVAVQLEALIYRDRYQLAEAIGILRENYEVEVPEAALEEMAAGLRPRYSRRFEDERALLYAAAPERLDEDLLSRERSAMWSEVHLRVREAMRALGEEDRLILRLRFDEGLTVAAISRELQLDQRRLYARVNRLLRILRRELAVDDEVRRSGVALGPASAPA